MRTAALSIAFLLGIATLGGAAQAQTTPTVSATVVFESGPTVLIGGKRHYGHHGFHRGSSYKHKGFARHHKRWHGGRHHRPAFVARPIPRAPVVVVAPAWGRSFGYRYLPARPLIRNGSFARRSQRW
jgi:hypothetical protein